ncbi:hypothetical protein D3C78_1536280 [compost metagenome]
MLEPTAAHRASGAVGETQQCVDLVIDRNGALFGIAYAGRALVVHGLAVGAHRFDIAQQVPGHGQQVAAQVRQCAAGVGRFAAP